MEIHIGWLFPALLSTYGDRGNLTCLQRRAQWRGIACHVLPLDEKSSLKTWKKVDLFLGGGAQDRQQAIVMKNLSQAKRSILKEKIPNGVPALFTCALFQLMGAYYKTSEGKILKGLGLLDFFTVHQGQDAKRSVGNTVTEITARPLRDDLEKKLGCLPPLIGFENHGGHTHLENAQPLATVVKGSGNNGADGMEGVFYHNMIGTYLHGPLLPKNPFLADWLIEKALEHKYKAPFSLPPLDDKHADNARQAVLRRYGMVSLS
ncbi:MAG: cobalamin biosynthesis protein CobQ [Verrucomicrobia bacterium]|nr:cobalamin biosynthesis protein CobQ [Verrucomicrobiota bacterium]